MRYALALLTLVLVAAPAAAQTAAVSLDDIVRGVEAAYSRMTDLKAEISQTSFNKSLNQTIPAAGTVYLKKGGKLRWEYTEPTRQGTVSGGKTAGLYPSHVTQAYSGPPAGPLAGPARPCRSRRG